MKPLKLLAVFTLFSATIANGQIIDMHLHAYSESNYWGGSTGPAGLASPATPEEHRAQTLKLLDENNVEAAVVCGSLEALETWTAEDSRLIPGLMDEEPLPPVDRFEELVKSGKVKVFGEITAVYQGKTLNDPMYEPYLAVCEKYGVPVAYHTGGGPPMIPYDPCCPNFRISLGDPLLIEDVLVKHPNLKLYLMHGGEVFFEHAVRMMSLYRQLYVDIAVLLWADPIVEDYAVRLLKLARKAGVLDRVMFGSDQMVWPEAINSSIDYLNSMDFLTQDEKEMILYRNAKRFLGMNDPVKNE
ncbi:MAG: amidohydrolase family protein [Candidatus Zixiibacteriota bacterium]|jgi:hypothetical protein